MSSWNVIEADCVEAMRAMDEASIDAIVCDPPYGLGFMGKEWDTPGRAARATSTSVEREGSNPYSAGKAEYGGASYGSGFLAATRGFQAWCEAWAREAYRILKPGGHLLAFGGTRTYHRLACAVEDAGFEIRDSLIWIYGSGFPKSLDVSKAIDKAAGHEREITREATADRLGDMISFDQRGSDQRERRDEPATPEAAEWKGWGTALKPAHEPIVVARKPLAGTVAANVLEYGTGALNVDGCRVEGTPRTTHAEGNIQGDAGDGYNGINNGHRSTAPRGRWPANVVLGHHADCVALPTGTKPGEIGEGAWRFRCAPDCPASELDRQSGTTISRKGKPGRAGVPGEGWGIGTEVGTEYDDFGGASRYFYCAKASRGERNAGLGDNFTIKRPDERDEVGAGHFHEKGIQPQRNAHPTVKPIALMRWLVRLVTPPGGLVVDPFCGSGTTGCAAVLEAFDFIGIEREAEYAEIARARIGFWARFPVGTTVEQALGIDAIDQVHRAAGQVGLFDIYEEEAS